MNSLMEEIRARSNTPHITYNSLLEIKHRVKWPARILVRHQFSFMTLRNENRGFKPKDFF